MRSFLRTHGAHLILLLSGSIVLIGGCFSNSLWFDEAYTVGLMQHSFPEVLHLSIYDVHPPLYYLLLKLFTLLFGNSIGTMRLFSALGGICLAGLGWTHLRKDFGRRVGFWFSFCALFCAATLYYSLQIRMYTWASCFTTLALLYAYRMERQPDLRQNRVCFLLFSVCAAYTHYFALFTVAAANLLLLYRARKEKRPLRFWLQNAAVQIGAYIPGCCILILQMCLGGPGWMKISWPDLVFDWCSYPFLGVPLYDAFSRIEPVHIVPYTIAGGLFWLLQVGIGILLHRQYRNHLHTPEQKTALAASLRVIIGVLLFALSVSLFRPFYYIRYTVILEGLLFFLLALLLASFRKKTVRVIAAAALLLFFGTQAGIQYRLNYHPSSNCISETLTGEILPEDAFVFDDLNGFVVSVQFPENAVYYYNLKDWNVENAYRGIGRHTQVVTTLKECTLPQRIWTVGRGECYQQLVAEGYQEADTISLSVVYHDIHLDMILLVRQP